jgi:hypothetical protein
MSGDLHHDGGRLRQASVAHRHVVEHDDGTVSAIVIRDVPALICDLCEVSATNRASPTRSSGYSRSPTSPPVELSPSTTEPPTRPDLLATASGPMRAVS